MNEKHQLETRIHQVLQLVAREDSHLLAVRRRFFGDAEDLSAQWLEAVLENDIGVDRLESFVGKFTRMQDTLMDKLIPLFLKYLGEPVGTAIDNLNRMERLGFIAQANDWLEMRFLRNRLVHEYIEHSEDMLQALARAKQLTDVMHEVYCLVDKKLKEA